MSSPLISLCMIVKNEEEVISRCLQSVKQAVDEIIVIDTGSTDGTVEAARKEGAAVYIRQWQQDFSAARNESIALATGDWILVLDADETLEDDQGTMLRQLVSSTPEADGFFVKIVNFIGTETKQAGSSVSSSLRLFRNKPGYRYTGRIHEQIVQPILTENPAAKLHFSPIQLNHGGYLPEVVQRKNKVQRNMELLQQELENTDNESFHRYNLGVEYMRVGEYPLGLEQFRLSRTIADWRKTSFGHVVVLREANCLQALGQWEAAAEVCRNAAGDLSDYPDLFFTLGRIHYHLRQWEAAEAAFQQALNIGEAPPNYTSASGAGTYAASFQLGKVREQLNDYEGAIQYYAKTLKLNANLLSPFLRLISLLARLDPAHITDRMERLFHLESPKTWWSIALSYYQLGLYDEAAQILKQKPVPKEKKQDRQLLLLRCQLLSDDRRTAAQQTRAARTGTQPFRRPFYEALLRNDDQTALRLLKQMEQQQEQQRRKLMAGALESSASGPVAGPSGELILNLYAHLLYGKEQREMILNLPSSAYSALWSELYFLYMLAAKAHLFTLQTEVQAYWRKLLMLLPDPVQRLKGRYELIKTVHVRIYQIFQDEGGVNLEYAALWNDVKPRLMTLIDDLLMEEVI